MTPEQLKASILQYAIQGKLVEQRPEEGTGEELYRQIQQEKQRLIKEGKIKKEKPLPEIAENELPFDIPERWRWCRFSELMNSMSTGPFGSMLHKSDYVPNGIPLVNPANIVNGTIIASEKMMVSEETAKRLESYTLQTGMIIMGRRGEMGRCAVVGKEEDGWLCGTGSFFMMPSSCVFVHYLSVFITTPFARGYLSGASVGTTMSNLNHKILNNMPVPLPPLAEQKRIVAKIEELLPYIDRYVAAYEKLERFNAKFPEDMKKSILQYAIQGKLVEQRPEEGTGEELYQQIQEEKKRLVKEGKIKKEKPLPEIAEDEIPFDIPESWKWVRWGNLSQSIQYGYNAPAKSTGRIKMVRISDIQNGNVAWETVPFCDIDEAEIPTYRLAINDILFARTGGTVGKSYIVKEILEDAIYAGYLIRTRYSDTLCPEYLYYFMQTQLYWSQLRSGTITTAQPNCNGQTLSKMILPLPSFAEQKRIVAKLEQILPLCERLK